MQTSLLKIIFALAIVMIGLALPLGCGKDGPTGGGGVDSLRASITSPAEGAVVHGPSPLQVQITGSSGNTKVKFIIDAVQVSVDSVAPWEYVWDPTPLQNGSGHTFRAIVSDNSGNADTTGVRTYIANYAKLTITVQSPTNGSVIPTPQMFGATIAGGAGGTVVNFIVDNVTVASDSTAPFQYSWDPSSLPSGSAHTVQLTAADTAGQTAASTVRTVYAKYLPLSATISSPSDSSVIGQVEDIIVAVSGGAGGNTASFFLDGSPVLVDNTPPLAYSWDPTSLLNGSAHTVYAIVSDTGGQTDTTTTQMFFAKWRLLGSGTQSPHPINVRNVFARSTPTALQFRVEFDNDWIRADSVGGIDCVLYFDSDQNHFTGDTITLDGNQFPWPINDIGADYKIIVGGHGNYLWSFDGLNWVDSIPLLSLSLSRNTNFFECSVLLNDVGFPEVFDLVVANVRFESKTSWTYDWVPTSGHLTYIVDGRYIGPPVSSPVP
jgi:hypothetical protein